MEHIIVEKMLVISGFPSRRYRECTRCQKKAYSEQALKETQCLPQSKPESNSDKEVR
jgi:hypothetical protein